MKILVVTEKYLPDESQRDGGASLVDTLKKAFGTDLAIAQFGDTEGQAEYSFKYPKNASNRFERRMLNSKFIAQKIQAIEFPYTHLIFVHVSMLFGLAQIPKRESVKVWTFPMFLSPSYIASNEQVPPAYIEEEKKALALSDYILTPSYYEKNQLIKYYEVPEQKISVIPRGIDAKYLRHSHRNISSPLRICSIGSIKPQKNTLALIDVFSEILANFPGAFLDIIGPIQCESYAEKVVKKIKDLGLTGQIKLWGHVPKKDFDSTLKSAHFHISTSLCETFGRNIFETLAMGIPNIALKPNNAAYNFLMNLPYVAFVELLSEICPQLKQMAKSFSKLSEMSYEINEFYDDSNLKSLIISKISCGPCLVASDFDGTLFHQSNPTKTKLSVSAFNSYPVRVLCSARPLDYLINSTNKYNISVDWYIAYGGAVIADSSGLVLWDEPLSFEGSLDFELEKLTKHYSPTGKLIQVSADSSMIPKRLGHRVEIYQDKAFLSSWKASKLHALHKLLKWIRWQGQVKVFGDGPYDQEIIHFFDGKLITNDAESLIPTLEMPHV